MNFEVFLHKKKIDSERFKAEKPDEWQKLCNLYRLMGEKSFDHQKKFLFNPLRIAFAYSAPIASSSPKEEQPLVKDREIAPKDDTQVTTPPPSMKKPPIKAKPLLPLENEAENPPVLNTPPPSMKKPPIKAKPILAPENEAENPPVLNTPPPSMKKPPIKAKPLLPPENEAKKNKEGD